MHNSAGESSKESRDSIPRQKHPRSQLLNRVRSVAINFEMLTEVIIEEKRDVTYRPRQQIHGFFTIRYTIPAWLNCFALGCILRGQSFPLLYTREYGDGIDDYIVVSVPFASGTSPPACTVLAHCTLSRNVQRRLSLTYRQRASAGLVRRSCTNLCPAHHILSAARLLPTSTTLFDLHDQRKSTLPSVCKHSYLSFTDGCPARSIRIVKSPAHLFRRCPNVSGLASSHDGRSTPGQGSPTTRGVPEKESWAQERLYSVHA